MKKTFRTANYLALGAFLLTLAPLASCSNEEAVEPAPEVTPARPLAPGEETIVEISIPGLTDSATRATVDASDTEATINSLYFFAFPTTGSSGELVAVNLKEKTPGSVGTSSYGTGYSVTMKAGKYNVYVVANLNNYLTEAISTSTPKATLDALVLNFSNLKNDKGIKSNDIPMACKPGNIKYQVGDSGSPAEVVGDEFELSSSNTKLYADLTMLCAKVRYTILFDLTDYSSDVHYATGVTFTSKQASNVQKEAGWIADATSSIEEAFDIPFGDKIYPDSDTDLYKYIKDPNNENTTGIDKQNTPPADLANFANGVTLTDNEDTKKRAWQGTIYIPENATDTEASQTTFTFTANPDGNFKGGAFKGKFERGNFYDFVAKITQAKVEFSDVNVYVKVNPWTYKPQEIAEW